MKYVKLFEQFLNENEDMIDIKKEIKKLKDKGYKASKWGDGIVVRGVQSPNPAYNSTVDMAWDPEDGISSDDDALKGTDQSYDMFLHILANPTEYNGQWE